MLCNWKDSQDDLLSLNKIFTKIIKILKYFIPITIKNIYSCKTCILKELFLCLEKITIAKVVLDLSVK